MPTLHFANTYARQRKRDTKKRVEQRLAAMRDDEPSSPTSVVENFISTRAAAGTTCSDFSNAEYDQLIAVARDASRRNTGVELGGNVAAVADELRSSMSTRAGFEAQSSWAPRGTFDALLPDVGALQQSGLVDESRHFVRHRYKSSTDGNVQTVRRHWFDYTMNWARTSPIRPLCGNSLDMAMIEEDLWINFVAFLARRVIGPTVAQYISLLKRWHKSVTGWDPMVASLTNAVMLSQAIAGVRADLPSKNRKRFAHPIRLFREWREPMETMTRFGRLSELVPRDCSSVISQEAAQAANMVKHILRDAGMSLDDFAYIVLSSTMTAGLMRISEASPTPGSGHNVIVRDDIRFVWDASGKMVRAELWMQPLKKTKNTPKVPVIMGYTRGNIQAAYLLWLWCLVDPVEKDASATTPLIRYLEGDHTRIGKIIGQPAFRTWYTRKLEQSGVRHAAHYSLHSFRIAGATALLAAGCSIEQIKAMGRWASDIAEIYARPGREMLVDLSRRLDTAEPAPIEDEDDGFFDRIAGAEVDEAEAAAEALLAPVEIDAAMVPERLDE